MSRRTDWIVFAEDWGAHPSTTQHLVAHFAPEDRVLWIDSLGMRSPTLSRRDLARVLGRLQRSLVPRAPSTDACPADDAPGRTPDRVLRPPFLPWHGRAAARALNGPLLGRAVSAALRSLGMDRPVLVTANPIVFHYLAHLPPAPLVYLRLDDYAALPGVDPSLIAASEPGLIARADLVVAPNPALIPDEARRTLLLPQGVDVERFSAVPPSPPDTRVIGYWGTIDRWLDLALVAALAESAPEWTFELRGRARPEVVADLPSLPNLRLLEPVPHHRLAAAAAHWRGAWAPFRPDLQLPRASPLKLREYLAAGLPTASSPIPEARALPHVTLVGDLAAALRWLREEVAHDSPERRAARRASQADAGWQGRAEALRRAVLALPRRGRR